MSMNSITLSGSLIEPFPLMYTRQPVVTSTRLSELPLGPRSRPTKLNWKTQATEKSATFVNFRVRIQSLIWQNAGPVCIYKSYIWIKIHWNLQAQNPLYSVWTRACRCALPIHCHSRVATQSLWQSRTSCVMSNLTERGELVHDYRNSGDHGTIRSANSYASGN